MTRNSRLGWWMWTHRRVASRGWRVRLPRPCELREHNRGRRTLLQFDRCWNFELNGSRVYLDNLSNFSTRLPDAPIYGVSPFARTHTLFHAVNKTTPEEISLFLSQQAFRRELLALCNRRKSIRTDRAARYRANTRVEMASPETLKYWTRNWMKKVELKKIYRLTWRHVFCCTRLQNHAHDDLEQSWKSFQLFV